MNPIIRKFTSDVRKPLPEHPVPKNLINNGTPGPGYYNFYSEFGWWKKV